MTPMFFSYATRSEIVVLRSVSDASSVIARVSVAGRPAVVSSVRRPSATARGSTSRLPNRCRTSASVAFAGQLPELIEQRREMTRQLREVAAVQRQRAGPRHA